MTRNHTPMRFVRQAFNRYSNLENPRDRARRGSIAAITLFTAVFVALSLRMANAGSEPESTLNESVQAALAQANLVVIAEIVGLVDTKPGAQLRRNREAHRVRVLTTLKGKDLTGRELIVRPAGMGWPDGEQHVLFLMRSGEPFAQAIDAAPVPADNANVNALRALIAERGEGVEPAPLLEAEIVEGWSIEPGAVLNVDVNGRLSWKSAKDDQPVSRVGAVPIDRVEALVSRIRAATPGPLTDDGSMLRVRWQATAGKEQIAVFDLTSEGTGTMLLEAIRDLVRSSE